MRLVTLGLVLLTMGCRSDEGIKKFNSTPEANITSHVDGDTETEGYSVTFMGTGSDANHGIGELTATWYAGSEIICDAETLLTDGTTICASVIGLSDAEITLVVKDPENASAEAKVNLLVTPSDVPTAEINSPLANGVYYSDQKITFAGFVGDSEDEAEQLLVTWNSDLDGDLAIANEPTSSGELVGADYLTEGEHFIMLTVADTTGKEGTDNVIITVGPPNSNPLCEITSPVQGSAGPQGELVTFTATADDVDIPEDMLSALWRSDKDGELGSSAVNSDGSMLFPFADLSVNTHVITLTVTDENDATCTSSISYTVGTPPTIVIDSPIDGNTYSEGEVVVFSATVSDEQDQPNDVVLDWSLNGSSVSTQGATSSGNAEFSDAGLADGSYNLVVTATDTDGLTDSDQINFTINGLPTQPVVSIIPAPANTNDTLTVTLDTPSTDPEGSAVNYTYEWLLGGAVQSAYTSSTVPSSATNKNQQWTVRVTPNDGIADGPVGEATITIANTEPTLSSLAITPLSNVTNDITLTCSVVVTDPDETLMPTYEWSLGSTVVGSGSTLDLSTTGAMPTDVVTCAASVVDGDGATASDSTTTTIENRVPSVSGATINPSTGVTTGTSLTCTATVFDADGESPTVSYEWSVGSSTYNGDSISLDNTMVSPGDSITCTVSTEDGYGGTAADSATVTIENTLPVISASISVDGIGNMAELSCLYTTSDADDSPTEPTVTHEWFDSTGASLGTSNPLQLDGTMGVAGDAISCVATAIDLSGGTASDTVVHTITNTSPVVDSIAINPPVIDALTSSVGCEVTSSDADGDVITHSFAWFVDGALQTETSNVFLESWVVGTEITCQATPNDGKSDGDIASYTVTVSNTAPVVDSVLLSPSTAYTNDTLTATVVFSDDDSTQSVSGVYAWHVIDFDTGTDTEVQSGSDNTLSGVTHFDRDDEVYVVVTPNDGVDFGLSFTSSGIGISNTAPTAPSISISPAPATAGQDDLVCSVDTSSADADGDTVVYTYVWRDDVGAIQQTTTAVTATADTFAAADTTEGTWTCEVTPADGTDSGQSATATVAVEDSCYSLLFDGDADGVLVGDSQNMLGISSDFTIGSWVYVNGNTSSPSLPIFTAESSNSSDPAKNAGFALRVINGNLGLFFGTGLTGTDSYPDPNWYATSPLPTDEWVHVAGVRDGSSVLLYVNGSLVFADTNVSTTGISYDGSGYEHDHYYIGRSFPNGLAGISFSMDGLLSNVGVWSRGLSATEIQQLAETSFDSSIPDLVGHWSLSDATGTTVTDQSSLVNDGVLQGDATWINTCPEEDLDGDGVPTWEDCDDNDPNVTTGESGAAESCPSIDCAKILADGYSSGDGNYWIDPQQDGSAYEVYCLMDSTYDGGGWTLISVHSDDGQNTWTWDNRRYFDTDTTTFGSLSSTNKDFKSDALHDVGMEDLLFVHSPSGIWAGYNDIDSGSEDFGTFLSSYGELINYSGTDGIDMSTGTLTATGDVCSTQLFINAADGDGGNDSAHGPGWSTNFNHGCPLDDAGIRGGLGPVPTCSTEWNYDEGVTGVGVGFGYSLGVNSGGMNAAENYMQVFVRRDYTDADGDDVSAWEDCDDGDPSMPVGDADCDGVVTSDDCNDDNPDVGVDCYGCADGTREGFTDVNAYPDIATCAGSWSGLVSSTDAAAICESGWHVCDRNDSALRSISFGVATSFSGCYAINASHDHGNCNACTTSSSGNDMGGVGSGCGFQSSGQSSCLANGRIDVVSHQINSCYYQAGRTDGVVCCRD